MFHFEKMIFFEWYFQGHRKVFLCIETKFIFQNKCLKKAILITCTGIYTYVKKAAYMYISTSTHCPYPFHEKEHSWNLIFTYCAGEISSVIELKSSWFKTFNNPWWNGCWFYQGATGEVLTFFFSTWML